MNNTASICVHWFAMAALLLTGSYCSADSSQTRPNILWITVEDMSANLGCYGDPIAKTAHLDNFATESVRYSNAYATAPVCSPVRSCLITGIVATSLGTQRLRSTFPLPATIRGFPSYLKDIGYFTSNNVKTDYNVQGEKELIRESWNRNGNDAGYAQRSDGQPFFSVINLMTTHQSRTSTWTEEQFETEIGSQLPLRLRTAPTSVKVPAYYPDTTRVRQGLARYYDCIAKMDQQVGAILEQLASDGVADNTIVFFFSDHGMGMPRGKRLLHDSGMHVPLMIRFPPRLKHLAPADPGQIVDRLVSFVDFPATIFNVLGMDIPPYMQGIPFLGKSSGEQRDYIYGARDRVDEAYDVARSVRDKRFLYIRNYMPHLSWMQPEWYSDQSPLRRELKQMFQDGALNASQLTYSNHRRPIEELYDTRTDPEQIHNLASSRAYLETLRRMRKANTQWILDSRDLGFLPESDCWKRCGSDSPRSMALAGNRYPLERIARAARLSGAALNSSQVAELLKDNDPAVRYWGVISFHNRSDDSNLDLLRPLLQDPAFAVRIEAANVLALNDDRYAIEILVSCLDQGTVDDTLHACRALELLGHKSIAALPSIKRIFSKARDAVESNNEHPGWLFVLFSTDSLMWQLEPNSTRERIRF